jgi:hypothetical protein
MKRRTKVINKDIKLKPPSQPYLSYTLALILLVFVGFFFPGSETLPYYQALSSSFFLGLTSILLLVPFSLAGAYALGTFRLGVRDSLIRALRVLTMLPSLFWLGCYSLLAYSFRSIVPDFLLANSLFLISLLLVIKTLPFTIRSFHEVWNVRGNKTLLSLQSLGLTRYKSYATLMKYNRSRDALRIFGFSLTLILSDAVLFYLIGGGIVNWGWGIFEPSLDLPSKIINGLMNDFQAQKGIIILFCLAFWLLLQNLGRKQFIREYYG